VRTAERPARYLCAVRMSAEVGKECVAVVIVLHPSQSACNRGRPSQSACRGRPSQSANIGRPPQSACSGRPSQSACSGRPSHSACNGHPSHSACSGLHDRLVIINTTCCAFQIYYSRCSV